MKKIVFFIFICFVSISFISCNTKIRDKKAIQECFDKLDKAIYENNGLEAIKYIDNQTIAYYNNVLKLAKTSDSVTISKMKFWDKTSVMVTRHLFKKEDILNMNGENLFILLVSNEMFSDKDEELTRIIIQNIEINGNIAKGEIFTKETGRIIIKFHKINNEWKFDLTSMFPVIEKVFNQVFSESDVSITEDDFLILFLKEFNQKEPSKGIWKPIL